MKRVTSIADISEGDLVIKVNKWWDSTPYSILCRPLDNERTRDMVWNKEDLVKPYCTLRIAG